MSIVWERISPPDREFRGRVSSNKDDPGFWNWSNLGGIYSGLRVMLNGVESPNCTMADSIEGVVIRHKMDDHGGLQIAGPEFVLETLKGHVQVFLPTKSMEK